MLRSLPVLLGALDDELRPHLTKEELLLFPYIDALESASRARRCRPMASLGAMRNPVLVMMLDHDHAEGLVRALKQATSDFIAPDRARQDSRAPASRADARVDPP